MSGPFGLRVSASAWAVSVPGLREGAGAGIPHPGMPLDMSRLCARGEAAAPGRFCDLPVVPSSVPAVLPPRPVREGTVREGRGLFSPSISGYFCRKQA